MSTDLVWVGFCWFDSIPGSLERKSCTKILHHFCSTLDIVHVKIDVRFFFREINSHAKARGFFSPDLFFGFVFPNPSRGLGDSLGVWLNVDSLVFSALSD